MTTPSLLPSDDFLRAALTSEPHPGLSDQLIADLMRTVERTPQRPRRWTFAPSMPASFGQTGSFGRPHLNRLAWLIVLALLAAALLAVASVIGGLVRRSLDDRPRSGLIGYDSGGHIFVTRADGSETRQLTFGAGRDIEPAFSPDGSRIAYESLDAVANQVRLFVIDADGAHPTLVATMPAARTASGGPSVDYPRVSWSPDSRRLAYSALRDASPQVFVVRADGSGSTPIGAPGLDGQDPAWSPDGTRIAFRGGHFDVDRGIYLMNADGTGLARLSPQVNETIEFGSEFSPPAWSPDGDLIAYSQLSTTSSSHVVVVPAAGGAVRELSGMEGSDWGPAWSPDATSIAWRRAPTVVDFGHFVIARLDGSQQRFLAPRVAGSPTWSPDGTQLIGLADLALTGQVDSLLVIDIAHGSFVELPAEPSGKPTWQWLPPR